MQKANHDLELLSINLFAADKISNKDPVLLEDNNNLHSKLINERIDLIRYDPKWEINLDRIKFTQKIGQGVYGKVFKAIAIDIRPYPKVYDLLLDHPNPFDAGPSEDGQTKTIVAIKMLKNHPTMDQLRSLSRELKVMNYLGHHINVVNLLGACTTRLIKKELYVLMEYCCLGNLQQFLQEKKASFITRSTLQNENEKRRAILNVERNSIIDNDHRDLMGSDSHKKHSEIRSCECFRFHCCAIVFANYFIIGFHCQN